MADEDSTSSELQQSLTRLHSRLSGAPSVDERSKLLLRDVLGDIERLLARPAAPLPADSPGSESPSSRLEALSARFDAGHPTLSASLRELIDLLGRAGL
jgi:hypothetical protein